MSSRTPTGIDVGSRQIKAAQLRRTPGGWRTEALCAIPRTRPGESIDADEVRYLQSALSRQGFCGNDVVLAVPDEKVLTGVLELPPPDSGAPFDKIARTELARMHKVRPDSFEMSYWRLPAPANPGDSLQALAVGYAHADANDLMDTFESAGLDVRALDVRSSAAARACRTALAPQPGMTAILDLGWSASSLSILHQGAIAYQRVIGGASIKTLSETIAQRLNVDTRTTEHLLSEVGLSRAGEPDDGDPQLFDQAGMTVARHFDTMAQELQTPLSYTACQYPDAEVKRLLLVGGGACIHGLTEYLSSSMEMEVKAVAPADLAESPPSVLPKSGNAALTLAIGLAQFGEG